MGSSITLPHGVPSATKVSHTLKLKQAELSLPIFCSSIPKGSNFLPSFKIRSQWRKKPKLTHPVSKLTHPSGRAQEFHSQVMCSSHRLTLSHWHIQGGKERQEGNPQLRQGVFISPTENTSLILNVECKNKIP